MKRIKRIKRTIGLILMLTAALTLVACGTKDNTEGNQEQGEETMDQNENQTENVTPTVSEAAPTTEPTLSPTSATAEPTPTATAESSTVAQTGDEFFDTLTELDKKLGKRYMSTIMSSFLSTGNTYRMNRVLDRAKAGEEITIAFIGGSVTEGALATERTPQGYQKGYAYLTYEYLCKKYGTNDNIKLVSSGVSGTSSFLGIVRSDVDILDYKPDLIFVEFAVNNGGSLEDRQSFESLIRKFLNAENEPAVALLFSDATYAGGTQSDMEMTGHLYQLPMMSMHTGLARAISTETISWNDYSGDYAHPTQDGHMLYAKSICYMINKVYEDRSATSYTVRETPSAKGYDKYVTAVILDNTDVPGMIETTGSFTASKTTFASTGGSDTSALHKGWIRKADAGNDDFVIHSECKNFILVVKQTRGPQSSLDVYVDNQFVKKINTSEEGAWNNSVTELILDEETVSEHEIRIRSSQGSEGNEQTILAMCYSR